ncbi:amino-acid oxidase [Fusarium beomiforme]|uniref:Amino-acid oxidase n=1 Tax=Fusarium beomiforme TaxID=44412 RepID=A0A9P5ADD8_9HYPO|nr:amino-acid oxidase [Fusarium beomiforme]
MSLPATAEHHLHTRSFKHMWARHVAQKAFDEDVQAARKRILEIQKENPDLFDEKIEGAEGVSEILDKTQKLTGLGFVPREPGKLEIGIVGAGVAGLFTAMVFDWLNEQCGKEGLKIEYDIMEAAKMNRLGGRLYTHRFSYDEHDYYDVGAMRFPNNTIMKRTFQLFKYIGLEPGKGGLIPYYLEDVNNVCPSYFNDVARVGNVWTEGANDPFKINGGLPEESRIPPHLLTVDPSDLVKAALKEFIDAAEAQFNAAIKENDEMGVETTKLWELLMAADRMSTRQFLASVCNEDDKKKTPIPNGPGYNYNTIEWLESATYGTGWYDQSLTECVLEELDFATPDPVKGQPKVNYWWCIDGGAQTIAQRMAQKIKQPVQFNSQVVAIDAQVEERKKRNPNDYTSMKLKINKNQVIKEKEYFAVFNSTTLGALQRMDLKDAGLLWGTKQAIRALGYGASCKVAIKFETAWWQKDPFKIKKGGVAHTDLPLRVCVYPSYNIESNEGKDWNPDKPAVLLCSYTWGQDAQRIGSLISSETPKNEEQLLSVLLHDLALLHSRDTDYRYDDLLKLLKEQYQDHHAYDWYRDENMSGAFAYFGPSQFSNMWQEIIKPNAYGQLYLIGEASSSHHAWIVGALESVIRAVYLMFEGLLKQEPNNKAYEKALKLLSQQPKDSEDGGDVFGSFPGGKGPDDDGKGGAAVAIAAGKKPDGGDDDKGDAGAAGAAGAPPPQQPQKLPTGLPFYPLPEEMPKRQLDANPDAKLVRDPLVDAKEPSTETSLLFASAMITLSLIESFFELEAEPPNDKPQ